MTGASPVHETATESAVLPDATGGRPWIREPAFGAASAGELERSRLQITLADLRARLRHVAAVIFLAGTAGGALALALPNVYTARASFFSDGKESGLSSMLTGMGGMLPLLALASGSMTGNESVFFLDLLKSQAFLDSLAASRVRTGTAEITVEEYVVRSVEDPAERRWKARKRLRRMIAVRRLPAGVVVIEIRANSPVAAAEMANRSVDLVDGFNVNFRQQQAAARRQHTQSFLDDVEARLRTAEVNMEQFLLANRSVLRAVGQSPVLDQRAERLRSEVLRLAMLKEQLASTVESARLTELNRAPVVVQIDAPAPPERRTGPPRLLITLGSMLLATSLLFWVAYIRSSRSGIA